MILVFLATLTLVYPAAAQKGVPPAGPQPTTFQPQAAPLDALLNDGWFIHSVAGTDGQILMLYSVHVRTRKLRTSETPLRSWSTRKPVFGFSRGRSIFKGTKFVRCYLSHPKDSMLRLDLSGMVFSTCHALN